MKKITDRLKSSNEFVSDVELLDYVISFQLDKIENYHSRTLHQTAQTINDNAENSMQNLIELLKLRNESRNKK